MNRPRYTPKQFWARIELLDAQIAASGKTAEHWHAKYAEAQARASAAEAKAKAGTDSIDAIAMQITAVQAEQRQMIDEKNVEIASLQSEVRARTKERDATARALQHYAERNRYLVAVVDTLAVRLATALPQVDAPPAPPARAGA